MMQPHAFNWWGDRPRYDGKANTKGKGPQRNGIGHGREHHGLAKKWDYNTLYPRGCAFFASSHISRGRRGILEPLACGNDHSEVHMVPCIPDTKASTLVDPPSTHNGANAGMHGEQEQLGRNHRTKKEPGCLQVYVLNTVKLQSPFSRSPFATVSSGEPYSLTHFIYSDKFSLARHAFIASLSQIIEPQTFVETMCDTQWHAAMRDKIRVLELNKTWTITPLPLGKKALGCKWVYKVKQKLDGMEERFKVCLVILGNYQNKGIDYTETFASVTKMAIVHIVLAVPTSRQWELHQMDVHNAFLHGNLHEDVYRKFPPRFRASHDEQYVVVLVYVDDLIISGNDHSSINQFKAYLHKCFHIKDLGRLKYFLGVEVAHSNTGIFLFQRMYTLDIITKIGLMGSADMPLEQNHRLALAKGAHLTNPEQYLRLVGHLIYV
ncbi:hypothetical protein L6164_026158 [Bauhinia variegata]|uniref:Uncharacterized protein n=1 Tax=Bauhinia variegata TaxID=167791 RepID=A0ACB9LP67_BAUVA|nr:hypothetical protein L6164_026158 [Bauhinia variegata]